MRDRNEWFKEAKETLRHPNGMVSNIRGRIKRLCKGAVEKDRSEK